jgi:D-alanyl-D-alanine carboxypeptidase
VLATPVGVRLVSNARGVGHSRAAGARLPAESYIDRTGAFQPKNAAPYLDRNRIDPGLLHASDPAVRGFTDRGWYWGGYWRTPIDYQHFER